MESSNSEKDSKSQLPLKLMLIKLHDTYVLDKPETDRNKYVEFNKLLQDHINNQTNSGSLSARAKDKSSLLSQYNHTELLDLIISSLHLSDHLVAKSHNITKGDLLTANPWKCRDITILQWFMKQHLRLIAINSLLFDIIHVSFSQ